jgi:pyroglutamyl-peptidase
MARILVTGFEPFLDYRVNPTARLVGDLDGASFAGVMVAGAVLPVHFERGDAAFVEAFERVRPDAVICLGLAGEIETVRVERVALNIDEAFNPDSDGVVRRGLPIEAAGPVGYWSTLPVDRLVERLTAAGLPAETSRDAGGYLCNHVFFRACHLIAARGLDLPCGFVHFPPLPDQVAGRPGRTGMPYAQMLLAAREIVGEVAGSLATA